MKQWIQLIALSCLTAAIAISASSAFAQEPEVHRDANGVIRFDPVRVEGRRQTAVSVLVPRQREVVGATRAQHTTFVRRVVRSVRSSPF